MTSPRKILRIADILVEKGYRVGQQVGEGTYSKVRTAERTSDGKTYAVKIVDKLIARQDYLHKFMPRELSILLKLKHENVVTTYEIIKERDFVFHIMQYAERGDLLRIIHAEGPLTEEMAKDTFTDVCKGVQYMHDKDIAHRDLKCENILILNNNHAIVGDFGFAIEFEDSDDFMCKTFCGSAAYASPELLRGSFYNAKSNDVWSLGIVLYVMICGGMPFDDNNLKAMVDKQLSKDIQFPAGIKEKTNVHLISLLFQILEPDISKRYDIKDVLESDWLQEK